MSNDPAAHPNTRCEVRNDLSWNTTRSTRDQLWGGADFEVVTRVEGHGGAGLSF